MCKKPFLDLFTLTKTIGLLALFASPLLVSTPVLAPVEAAISPRCSGPKSVAVGITYRTCIEANTKTVHAWSYMYTTKCAGTCAYPGDWTLRQSLYVNNAPTQVIEKRFSPSGQMYRVDVEWPTSAVKRKWEAVG
ncbi:MAG: hypothetical protein HWQ38_39390 [Nostoc sp. NMS7]|uniref:hypothetical protein n=1 Tax=Nostoc sp. NMS7 TaxID=2815391 RepID=UPI0025D29E9D|nr:hypothetical protein [Nostoc sp. NMS7]MBN3952219.1 hypothetical protein [Nostoc sp. NMS7]